MKKAFLFTLVQLGVSVALAYPMVGDKVEFKATKVEDQVTTEMTGSLEVVGYDEATKKWSVKKTWVKDGVERSETKETMKMFTPEMAQQVLTNCVSKGGTLEDVTVVAGTYASCKMQKVEDDDTKTIWWADVPFGVVKMMETEDDGDTKTAELTSVTLGQ